MRGRGAPTGLAVLYGQAEVGRVEAEVEGHDVRPAEQHERTDAAREEEREEGGTGGDWGDAGG